MAFNLKIWLVDDHFLRSEHLGADGEVPGLARLANVASIEGKTGQASGLSSVVADFRTGDLEVPAHRVADRQLSSGSRADVPVVRLASSGAAHLVAVIAFFLNRQHSVAASSRASLDIVSNDYAGKAKVNLAVGAACILVVALLGRL